ncbi:lipocalin-like domain-containing protein [Mesorhizobium sp. WSM4303]|nr:lipocalin-like domain-containing protein [Mesorhizobium sp. WSM4306]TRC94628.1 lipocalin-like domain-containing protein [Mesorhizobium sp. WSM4303]
MTLKIAALALALSAATPAFSHESPIVGAWRMTSLEVGADGNLNPVPYSGQVIFTEAGTLSVQAQNPDAKAPDTPYTTNGYEAYYGPVAINDQDKTFVITVESSLVRNLVGQSMKRKFEVSDNKLVLRPDNPAEGWRVTYERY